jgi:hypothetical protein
MHLSGALLTRTLQFHHASSGSLACSLPFLLLLLPLPGVGPLYSWAPPMTLLACPCCLCMRSRVDKRLGRNLAHVGSSVHRQGARGGRPAAVGL